MSNPEEASSERPTFLGERLTALTPDHILDSAREIEKRRSDAEDEALIAHHRLRIEGLTTTPYMHQAGLIARDRGVLAFNRLERAFVPAPKAWVHPRFGPDYYAVRTRGDVVQANALWPFTQDCPMADYQVTLPPKWWSHGLIHAMVGFGWWPDLTEWDITHMARLSEVLAAVHYYWLAELGRIGDDTQRIDLRDIREGPEANAYLEMEIEARDAETRLERLRGSKARTIAEHGLAILAFETTAYQFGMTHGIMLEPEGQGLDFGEACEYARVHYRRLHSPAFSRWVEHCLRPDIDYATNHAAFDVRCGDVLHALFQPCEVRKDVRSERAQRVLMDLGQRVCHLAALQDRPADGLEPQLVAIADALRSLRPDEGAPSADPDSAVSEVLARLARDIPQPSGEGALGPRELLALGYAPTSDPALEPAIAKAARAEAVVRRAWGVQPALGAVIEGLVPVSLGVVDRPRTHRFTGELREAAEPVAQSDTIEPLDEALLGWFELASFNWGPNDGQENQKHRWRYRLAWTALPDDADLTALVAMPNPYLNHLPMTVSVRWFAALLKRPRGTIDTLGVRPLTAVEYCLVGPGRYGPVVAPITPEISDLLSRLRTPIRVDKLIEGGVPRERVADAVARELMLVFHKEEHPPPPIRPVQMGLDLRPDAGDSKETIEDWNDAAQVEAYESFTVKSRFYEETSRELVERAGVEGAQRVADLGSGTGITTRAALARLGPEGRVVGFDPARRMVERARELVQDPRASFQVGEAGDILVDAYQAERYDRVLCNSALWLAADIKRELGRIRGGLADGGIFGFSIPAAFLGHAEHLETPAVEQLTRAINEVRQALDFDFSTVEPKPIEPALGSVENMYYALEVSAFKDMDFELWDYRWPASEYLDWMAMPVTRNGMVPPDRKADSERMIEMLRERLDPDLEFVNTMYFIIARVAS